MKDRPLDIIMLAGGLRASVFRKHLGIPTLRLPIGCHRTLLDAWLDAFDSLGRDYDVRIVVSYEDDIQHLGRLAERHVSSRQHASRVTVLMDPGPWRGTGGLLRDVTSELEDQTHIMVIESSCVPPALLHTALNEVRNGLSGVIGCSTNHEPCGVYVFRKQVFNVLPKEGFCDLKEQGLPMMHANGERLRSVTLVEQVQRVQNHLTCLAVMRMNMKNGRDGTHIPFIAPDVQIDATASVMGCSVLEPNVSIGRHAIVQDSLVLEGAVIQPEAVVSRSIVGYGATVRAGRLVRDDIVPFVTKTTNRRARGRIRDEVATESLINQR